MQRRRHRRAGAILAAALLAALAASPAPARAAVTPEQLRMALVTAAELGAGYSGTGMAGTGSVPSASALFLTTRVRAVTATPSPSISVSGFVLVELFDAQIGSPNTVAAGIVERLRARDLFSSFTSYQQESPPNLGSEAVRYTYTGMMGSTFTGSADVVAWRHGDVVASVTGLGITGLVEALPVARVQQEKLAFLFPLAPASERVVLATGCNNLIVTWSDGTVPAVLAAAVEPAGALVAIWRVDAGTGRVAGYAPGAEAASDLGPLRRLEAIFLCVRGPATITRPVLGL